MIEPTRRARGLARVSLSTLVLLLIVTSCQMTDEPSAAQLRDALENGVQVAGFEPDPTLRARFLPPIGPSSSVKNGEFVNEMPIEVKVFSLVPGDGAAVGPSHQTFLTEDAQELSVVGDTYNLAWPALDPAIAERVRIEIRMVGSGDEPVCNEYEGECLGFLDVSIVQGSGPGYGGGDAANLLSVPSGTTLGVPFKILVPTSLADLATLAEQGGIDPEALSCAAHEVAMPSQGLQLVGAGLQAVGAGLQAVGAGLQAVGAGGGLFAAPMSGTDSLAGRAVQLATLNEALLDFDRELKATNVDVANKTVILVLDDFGGDFELPAGLFKDRLNLPSTGTLGYDYSHGALVMYQLRTLLTELFGSGTVTATNGSYHVDFGGSNKGPKGTPATLRLQAVDARSPSGSIDTDFAAVALENAMKEAAAAGFRRAVVNMSFSIVPCGVLEDFERTEPVTFEEYVDALLDYNGVSGTTADAMGAAVRSPVTISDALLGFLACPRIDADTACGSRFDAIVNVAASGNYGLDFPLYPAAAAGVVSVGSQPHDGGFLPGASEFSNAAAVLAAGDVILLREDKRTGNGLAYIGTSFSAPFVSLFVALDQRAGSPTCDAGSAADPGENPPALASTSLAGLPLLPDLTPTGDAEASAVAQYCGLN